MPSYSNVAQVSRRCFPAKNVVFSIQKMFESHPLLVCFFLPVALMSLPALMNSLALEANYISVNKESQIYSQGKRKRNFLKGRTRSQVFITCEEKENRLIESIT